MPVPNLQAATMMMHVSSEFSRVTFAVEPFVPQVDEIETLPQVSDVAACVLRTLFDGERIVLLRRRCRQRLRRIDFHHADR